MDIEQIKEWMKNNMYTADILTCIRQSALTDQQKEQLNKLEKYVPVNEVNEANEVNEDVQAMDIAEQLPPQDVKKMFKRISKEDIVKELNQIDPADRQQAIVELCHKSGKNYRIEIRRNKLKIIDNKGEIVDDDDALDECAEFEAERIRQRMLSRWTSTMRIVKNAKEKGKYPPQEPDLDLDLSGLSLNSFGKKKKPLTKKKVKLPNNFNKKSIKGYNKGYSVSAKINKKIYTGRIVNSKNKKFKFTVKLNGKRYNFNSSQNKIVKLYLESKRSSFGKKKIVSRLRKTVGGSKYVSTTRKSPETSATLHRVGTTSKGLDGNMWTIKKASNGVKRWVKVKNL
jgi:hypothetical protein